MNNLPPEILAQIQQAICRPEGTVAFEYQSPGAFALDAAEGVLLQITSGAHLFRIERGSPRVLRFFHASPGTGTRVASIDLSAAPAFLSAFMAFSWTPAEIKFYCGPRLPGMELLHAIGVPSPRRFQVGTDGSVFQIGDEGVQVMGASVYRQGQPILAPTAIQAWENTVTAIGILRTGQSDQGFIYETVVSSLTLVMLVTGFEAYTKTRLSELEAEGIPPDSRALFDAFSSKSYDEMERNAATSGTSILRQIVASRAINFQNYGHVKKAYGRAYGIKLDSVGIASGALEKLQKYIRYRHQIVHVSPLLSLLNQPEVPTEEPVFGNSALADAALDCVDEVIRKLHSATLTLRRSN